MAQKPQITWVGSPNFGYPKGSRGRQGQRIAAVVHHIMQGTLAGTDSWFKNPTSGASTHFGIGRNGEIHQYVALEDAAWGNGLMNRPDMTIPWLRDCWNQNLNPNLITVSIEYDGAHQVDGAGRITNPNWAPTEAQYQAGLQLTAWLCETLGITPDNNTVIGHYRIDAVSRPYCPGPRFPFARMLADLAAPSWSLPRCRFIIPAAPGQTKPRELWGEIVNGRAMVQLPGKDAPEWIRPAAEAMGRSCRYTNTPPTVEVS